MPTVRDIYNVLNDFAPFSTMPSWDNSGLLVGDLKVEVKKAALCLDATAETIQQAKQVGVELMISHHPILFDPVQKIAMGSPEYRLIRAGIALISLHMPLDYLPHGPNRMLCEMLGLSPVGMLGRREVGRRTCCDGIVGQTSHPTTASELAAFAAKALGAAVHFSDRGKFINRVGVCGGAGGFLMQEAVLQGCDAMLTGECKHHETLEAEAAGLSLLIGGHFATEKHIPALLKEKLSVNFPEVEWMIPSQTNPCGNIAYCNE